MSQSETPNGAWTRQADESTLWYDRFTTYRLLGPGRSIEAAYRIHRDAEGLKSARPGHTWYEAAERWSWQARASSWDDQERQRLMEEEANQRFDARQQRLQHIAQIRGSIQAALGTATEQLAADIAKRREQIGIDVALELVAALRVLWKDALMLERLEYGEATEISESNEQHALSSELQQMIEHVYGSGNGAASTDG